MADTDTAAPDDLKSEAREQLGECDCPVCGSHRASVRVAQTAAHRAYVTCLGCKAQIFARGQKSDARLRALVRRAPAANDANEPAPAAPGPAAPAPAAPGPAEPAAPKKSEWDIY